MSPAAESSGIGRPWPLAQLDSALTVSIRYLLSDVDDTITSGGKLQPAALESLYAVRRAGIRMVLVTGGSAGWADLYFRQWPIDAVIAETGAVIWYRSDDGERIRLDHPEIERSGYRQRAERLIGRVLQEVPGSKLSADQFARIYDIAFDHHDEAPFLDEAGIDAIRQICREEGANCGVSSMHVNCWFGAFDKLSAVRILLEDVYGLNREQTLREAAYCGDAPNDAQLFAYFPCTFGVANVMKHAAGMTSLPTYVASREGGEGFAEIVRAFLESRQSTQGLQ